VTIPGYTIIRKHGPTLWEHAPVNTVRHPKKFVTDHIHYQTQEDKNNHDQEKGTIPPRAHSPRSSSVKKTLTGLEFASKAEIGVVSHPRTIKTMAASAAGGERIDFHELIVKNDGSEINFSVRYIIGEEGARNIAKALMDPMMKTKVRILNLSYCQIGRPGITAIAKALDTTLLNSLHLRSNHIGREGIAALAKVLETCRTIQEMDLSNNEMDDEGVIAIVDALEINPSSSLQRLYLEDNRIHKVVLPLQGLWNGMRQSKNSNFPSIKLDQKVLMPWPRHWNRIIY